jgi:hypothetical protein
MGVALACRDLYRKGRDWVDGFLANDDPLAAIANSGAFLVWSNQPFYPIYVWALVGRQAWPALLTWLSTPFFVGVALLGRTHPLASRGLFVVAGVVNTLISVKAFGANTAVGWFLVPCLVIAATFFRASEWKVAGALLVGTGLAALLVRHLGAPLHTYDAADARALAHLNLWSASVLSAYLLFVAVRARRAARGGVA